MNAYKLRYRLKSYLSIDITHEDLWETLGKITYPNSSMYPDGTPKAEIWQPIPARLCNRFYDSYEGKMPEISDFVGNMVLSPKAYEVLKDPLSACGELLPVNVQVNGNPETWYLFNATTICNAVDKENSEQDVMDGMIMGVHSLEFEKDVDLPLVFRTDYDRRVSVYCNQHFKDLVQGAGFEAVLFRDNLAAPM